MTNINELTSIPLKRKLRSSGGDDDITVASHFKLPTEIYDRLVKESMIKGITINMMIKLFTLARYGAVTLSEPPAASRSELPKDIVA